MDSSHAALGCASIRRVEVEGYDVEAMLGFGATGEVWRARERSSGEVVALKRLRPGTDPAALEVLRREATLLRRLDSPYVVRLRAVVGDVLVLDHAAGGSLAALLTRRGVLDPGEVVTVAVPLAEALACAHGLGMVHGDVSPANVLFTADGMPLLADLGVARTAGTGGAVDGTAEYVDPAVAAGGAPDPASDVWALAALCHHLLAGTPPHDGASVAQVLDAAVAGERAPLGLLAPSAPRALVAAVEAGLARDPAQRPDAAAFASLLRRAHATAPVRLSDGPAVHPPVRETHVVRAAAPDEPASRRWGLRAVPRQWLGAGGLALLVVLAAVVGWVSGRSEVPSAVAAGSTAPREPAVGAGPATPRPPSPSRPAAASSPGGVAVSDQPAPVTAPAATSPPPSAAVDWSAVLTALDDRRAQAFATADPARLAAVWAPGSDGLAADRSLVAALARDGRTAHGLRHKLRGVRVLAADDRSARLEVVDVLAEHEVRDRGGRVVQQVGLRGSAVWQVRLVAGTGGWRLAEVVPDA